eukprot:TRINITY_DN748_c0_g1_i10.p1 TRINITY_DN748_c0_g1~~TRINITY_DN748_c0_g1_i10.p1  ORF type:complete len:101 (-),score=18.46 TRINITY_DN748_c0_g1_i10:56-316(-)
MPPLLPPAVALASTPTPSREPPRGLLSQLPSPIAPSQHKQQRQPPSFSPVERASPVPKGRKERDTAAVNHEAELQEVAKLENLVTG